MNETTMLGDPQGAVYPSVFDSEFYVSGSISFPSGSYVRDWRNSTVTRNFDVVVMNRTGHPAADVEIALLTQDNAAVWDGFTDSLGRANFNLTFTDSNYTDTLQLQVTKENCFATMNVSFLSSSPIILTMRYFVSALVEGVRFNATSTGTYRFTIVEGACEVCPPEAQPQHPEWWGWNTAIQIYKNRPIEWEFGKEFNNPINWDFSVGDTVLHPTYEQAQEIGEGMFTEIHLNENDYLMLVVKDAKGCFHDNSGGIYLSIIILEHMPVALFICAPEKPVAGSQILFNASTSYSPKGNITSYEWDFDDGNITRITEPTINHTYTLPGRYNVTLEVIDNNTQWNTTAKIVAVYHKADLNRDETVNIMDIAMVARAYGSELGDVNWNAVADLDNNGRIDILDAATVARNYGKTV
jgi:PKD repeat protein/5-hydroxyisourate hydrolase-like protein (transthyretin family)